MKNTKKIQETRNIPEFALLLVLLEVWNFSCKLILTVIKPQAMWHNFLNYGISEFLLKSSSLGYQRLLTNESTRFRTGSDSVQLGMKKICCNYEETFWHGYPCWNNAQTCNIQLDYLIKRMILAELLITIIW